MSFICAGSTLSTNPVTSTWEIPKPIGFDGNGAPIYPNSAIQVTWTFKGMSQANLTALAALRPTNGSVAITTLDPNAAGPRYGYIACTAKMQIPQAKTNYFDDSNVSYWEEVVVLFTNVVPS